MCKNKWFLCPQIFTHKSKLCITYFSLYFSVLKITYLLLLQKMFSNMEKAKKIYTIVNLNKVSSSAWTSFVEDYFFASLLRSYTNEKIVTRCNMSFHRYSSSNLIFVIFNPH